MDYGEDCDVAAAVDGRNDGVHGASSAAVAVVFPSSCLPFAVAVAPVDDSRAFAFLRVLDALEVGAGDTPCSHAVAGFPSAAEGERSKLALTLVATAAFVVASQQAAERD